MKWFGITGSWRNTNEKLRADVRYVVNCIINQDNGIVTGGALGVDQFALEEALKLDPEANLIRVIIPASLERYSAHFQKRAGEGVISYDQANTLTDLLNQLNKTNRASLIEIEDGRPIGKPSYYDRNSKVVDMSDELFAFQVNSSAGVQDAVDKALEKGIPAHLKTYTIDD